MSTRAARLATALATALVAAVPVATAAAAQAATPTQTAITAPAGPARLIFNAGAGGSLTVNGTSNGGASPLDLRCESSDSVRVRAGVVPAADGTFSVSLSAADLAPLVGRSCLLRATPTSRTAPPRTPAFASVQLTVSEVRLSSIGSGPNSGMLFDYSYTAAQGLGRGTYASIGSCGLSNTSVFQGGTLYPSATIFACGAALPRQAGPRTGAMVDGLPAYPAATAATLLTAPTPASLLGGLQRLDYTASADPATGNVTIREQEQLVRCAPVPQTVPANSASCTSFTPAGVRLDRTWVQYGDGRVSIVTDSWYATDAKPHRIDLLYETRSSGSPAAFQFPWAGNVPQVFAAGFQLGGPGGPGTFFVRRANIGDTIRYAQGAVSFKDSPDSIVVADPAAVWLGYGRTVAPTGVVRLAFAYSRATTAAELATTAHAAQLAIVPPPCVVPRVLGLDVPAARAALHAAHCTIQMVRHEHSRRVARNHVKAQWPKTGSVLPTNGKAVLTVSKGQPPKRRK